MITNTSITKNYNQQLNFKARPIAQYNYLEDKAKKVIIYKLEKTDIKYLKNIANNLDKFYKKYDIDNDSAKQVIEEAFNAGIEILKETNHSEKEADILMAFYNNKPSSILIGNVLKTDKNGNLHYSSRKNHAKKETELDWLATWNKNITGEGQATVYEYFCQLLKSGFKQCFVRSELPEKSPAVGFYTKMGFEKLSEKPRQILRKNDNQYLIGQYDDECDKIIPMKVTVMDIAKIVKEKANKVMRNEITSNTSCELPTEIL